MRSIDSIGTPAFSSAISMLRVKLSYIGAVSMLFIFLFILENSGRKKINIFFKYLAYQVYYYLANFIKTSMDIASFIMTRKADFLVTADRVAIGASKKALHPAKGIAMAIESAGIIAFLGIGILFKNIWCVLISTASLLGFIILAMPKMNKPVIFAVYLIASLAFISGLAALFAYIR